MDLFDYKPTLDKFAGTELPGSVRMGQRITGMTSGQSSFPVARSIFKFQQHGKSGAWVSELLPHTAKIVDDLTIIKTMNTDAINHDPAITFIQTGSQQPGRPSMGAWVSYGLGSENRNLPAFVVMLSQAQALNADQPLFSRLWGSGLPALEPPGRAVPRGQQSGAVPEQSGGHRPGDAPRHARRRRASSNRMHLDAVRRSRDRDAHRAVRDGVPHADLRARPAGSFEGAAAHLRAVRPRRAQARHLRRRTACWRAGCSSATCGSSSSTIAAGTSTTTCRAISRCSARAPTRPSAALVKDLKQRGLLDDTLVIWGGEFGRTVYCQGKLTDTNYGRDHHPRCFTMWMAGGGIKPGFSFGETDDYCYNVVANPVHVTICRPRSCTASASTTSG